MTDTGNDWGDEPLHSDGMSMAAEEGTIELRRRAVLKGLAALGLGSVTFRRALSAQAVQAGKVTPEMIKQAEWIAGLDFNDQERADAARSVEQSLRGFADLRPVDVGYDVPPALTF